MAVELELGVWSVGGGTVKPPPPDPEPGITGDHVEGVEGVEGVDGVGGGGLGGSTGIGCVGCVGSLNISGVMPGDDGGGGDCVGVLGLESELAKALRMSGDAFTGGG